MKRVLRRVKAFTLAEVLVALTIIGIISALTVPVVVKNLQASQTKTAFKKVLNEVNQAIGEYTVEKGHNLAQTVVLTEGNEIQNMFVNYLGAKAVPDTNKWKINTNLSYAVNDTGSITAASTVSTNALADFAYLTLPDKMTLIVPNIYGCGEPHLAVANNGSYSSSANNGCIVYVDTNGQKGPNLVLMGATSSNPSLDACANVVVPDGEYLVKVTDKYCELTDSSITDVIPIVLFNDKAYPATVAGYWIFNDLIGETITEQESGD